MKDSSRQLLFLLACVPVRLCIVFFAYKYKENKLFALLTALVGLGFLIQHFRENNIGAFGQSVWWNRVIHSVFYLLFSLLYVLNFSSAWIVLLLDVIFGITSFITHYNLL